MIKLSKKHIKYPVCLIRPPTVTSINAVGQDAVPPLGLAYIAGAIEHAGIPTVAVDAVGEAVHQYTSLPGYKKALLHGLRTEEIVARIPLGTEVICVSCMFSVEWPFILPILNAIKESFPKSFLIVGGEHVNACADYILDVCRHVDACVLGEGEETIVDLLDAHINGKSLENVPGIIVRSNGKIFKTAVRKRITEIDEIPEPKWDIFPVEEYIDNALTHGANLGRCMPIMASRGCPYDCTFCSSPQMWTRKWNVRQPKMVIQEMKKYMKTYNVTNFDFYDLTAIIRKDWIMEFCQILIKENLNITWQLPSGTRSEAIDDEVTPLLYASGCRIMNYAPESGSPHELKRIRKKVDLGKMIHSMRVAHNSKIKIKSNFIFGLPGATWGDVYRTYGFIAKLAFVGVDDIAAFAFSPYPGSLLFLNLVDEGKITMNEEYFRDLLAYTDPANAVSYHDKFSARTLSVLNMATMVYFYILSCAFRPVRLFKILHAFIIKDTSTKLTMALSNVMRKSKAYKLSKEKGTGTVVISPTFKPTKVGDATRN